MGQFKPMVKMQTTEPSVVLKLKKGGSVKKRAMGGSMAPMVGRPTGGLPTAAAPGKPPLGARMRAMRGKRTMAAPVMAKKGGDVKAKKTGGVVKGQGGYKTGGVVNGQGGYKKGGAAKKADGGAATRVAPSMSPRESLSRKLGKVLGEKDYDPNAAAQDEKSSVLRAIAGRANQAQAVADVAGSDAAALRKKGGAVKRATGGAVTMPSKPKSNPVEIDRLAGTFKKGGAARKGC